MTPRPVLVDYGGLKVRKTTSKVLAGQAGYRPAPLLLAAFFLVTMVLLPVPGSLIGLVEEVNPPGYDMMEADTTTIVDSANYHKNPKAFEARRRSRGSAEEAENLVVQHPSIEGF